MKENLIIIMLVLVNVTILMLIIIAIYGIIGSRKRNKMTDDINNQMKKSTTNTSDMMEASMLHTKKSLDHMELVEKQLDRIASAIENQNKSNP